MAHELNIGRRSSGDQLLVNVLILPQHDNIISRRGLTKVDNNKVTFIQVDNNALDIPYLFLSETNSIKHPICSKITGTVHTARRRKMWGIMQEPESDLGTLAIPRYSLPCSP
jgi:hypothetical protein